MALRSFDQPTVDLTKIIISAPRIFAAAYSSSSPSTYDGKQIIDLSTPPTSGSWVDVGVVDAVQLTVDKTMVDCELGRPKTKRKTVEIKRDTKLAFVQKEFPIASLGLLFGLQTKNILTGAASYNVGTGSTRTSCVLSTGAGTNCAAGDRVCTAALASGLIDSTNRAVVLSVSTDTLTMVGDGFPVAPVLGHKIQKYGSVEMVDLMDTVVERSVLMFFDWIENSVQRQIAMWFPRMSTEKAFAPDLKSGDNFADAPVELHSTTTTQTLTNGSTASIHCIAYFFD